MEAVFTGNEKLADNYYYIEGIKQMYAYLSGFCLIRLRLKFFKCLCDLNKTVFMSIILLYISCNINLRTTVSLIQ